GRTLLLHLSSVNELDGRQLRGRVQRLGACAAVTYRVIEAPRTSVPCDSESGDCTSSRTWICLQRLGGPWASRWRRESTCTRRWRFSVSRPSTGGSHCPTSFRRSTTTTSSSPRSSCTQSSS